MTDRHATRDAILAYLSMSEGRRSARAIVAYMRDFHRVPPHTTQQMLWIMAQTGAVVRPRRGYYELGTPVEALNTTPPALTQAYSQAGATMDSTPPHDKDQDTGHKLELSDATTRLAEAVTAGDVAALRLAADAHATALNSQATAMAASIAAPVYTQLTGLSSQMKQLAEIVTNARQADLNWRTEERTQRDAQSDRLYSELDKFNAALEETARGLGKLKAGQVEYNARLEELDQRHGNQWAELTELYRTLKAQLERDEARLDRKRQELDDINTWRMRIEAWQADIDAWRAQAGGHVEHE